MPQMASPVFYLCKISCIYETECPLSLKLHCQYWLSKKEPKSTSFLPPMVL